MFVLISTYAKERKLRLDAEIENKVLSARLREIADKWNDLVARINRMGGEQFLNGDLSLSQEDIKKLLQLAHPDRHDGKASAVEMTQKLLKLRDAIKP